MTVEAISAENLLSEARRFYEYLTAVPRCLSWDTQSEEAELKDRFIAALSEGKLTLAEAVEISSIWRSISGVAYGRYYP